MHSLRDWCFRLVLRNRKSLMRKYKRISNCILSLILCLSSALFCACTGSSSSQEGNSVISKYVYYCNATYSDLVYREYTGILATDTAAEQAAKLLEQMQTASDDYADYYSVIPDGVEYEIVGITSDASSSGTQTGETEEEDSYSQDTDYDDSESTQETKSYTEGKADSSEGILTIDFSAEYTQLSNVKEILLRAAVVLTMVQIDGVDEVVFTVEGEPATDALGRVIGTMSEETFTGLLISDEGMLTQETNVTIYYACEDAESGQTLLVSKELTFTSSSSSMSQEEFVMQCLIEGPSDESCIRTVSADTVVSSVYTSNEVCYVNLSDNFADGTVSDELVIYSIVNSLCKLEFVSSVQFIVGDDPAYVLHEVYDLSQPFSFNASLNLN